MHTTGTVQVASARRYAWQKGEVQKQAGSDNRFRRRTNKLRGRAITPSTDLFTKEQRYPQTRCSRMLPVAGRRQSLRIKLRSSIQETCALPMEPCAAVALQTKVRAVRTSMMTHGGMLWAGRAPVMADFLMRMRTWSATSGRRQAGRTPRMSPRGDPGYTHQRVLLTGRSCPWADGKFRSRATCCGCSKKAAASAATWEIRIRMKSPASPSTASLAIAGVGAVAHHDLIFTFGPCRRRRLYGPTSVDAGTNDHPGDYRHSSCTTRAM